MQNTLDPILIVYKAVPLDIENGVTLPLNAILDGFRAAENSEFGTLYLLEIGANKLTIGASKREFEVRSGFSSISSLVTIPAPYFLWKTISFTGKTTLGTVAQEYGFSQSSGVVISYLMHGALSALEVPARKHILVAQDDLAILTRGRALLTRKKFQRLGLNLNALLIRWAQSRLGNKFDQITAVSEIEVESLAKSIRTPIVVLANGVEIPNQILTPWVHQNPCLVVFGDHRSPRNLAGARLVATKIAKNCWESISREASTKIVGGGAEELVGDSDIHSSVQVLGYVENLASVLSSATVSLCMQPVATGIKNSVLVSQSFGLVSIVSPAVAKTLPTTMRQAALTADTAEDAVRWVRKLHEDRVFARELSLNSKRAAAEHGNWSVYGNKLLLLASEK